MTLKAGKETMSDRVFFMFTHNHSPQRVFPSLGRGVTLASGGAGDTLSAAFIEIVPINTITLPFDIHWLNFSNPNANADYEIVLYAGEVEIGRDTFERLAANVKSFSSPVQMDIQPPNTQIQAKMADSVGGSTVVIKLKYHEYTGD